MTRIRVISFVIACSLIVLIGAAPTTAPIPSPAPTQILVSRLDVMSAYARFDDAIAKHPPADDEARKRVSLKADEATRMLFRRDYSSATQRLDELTESLTSGNSTSIEARVARSMRVRVGPRVAQAKRSSPLRVKITPAYAIQLERPVKLKLVIRLDEDNGAVVFEQEITVETNGLTGGITTGQPNAPVGRYRVELVAPDGSAHRVADWFVADRSIGFFRQENEKRRLPFIKQSSWQMAQAASAVAARNSLLSEQVVESDLAASRADPVQLANEVEREITELMADRDPFVDRAGDYWRSILVGAMPVPSRVYAPSATIGKRTPLLIVLPGLGNDETFFMDGIGGRALRKLADEQGLLVVVAQTNAVAGAPDAVNGLVRAMSVNYLVDESRVYVIGFATGAPTAVQWSRRYADRLTGVCALGLLEAFPPLPVDVKSAPTLIVNGALDAIAPMPSGKSFEEMKSRGVPIEFRVLPNTGHTLLPNDALPDAMKWLLDQPPIKRRSE